MAINKITAATADSPSTFASPVINQLAALLTVASSTKRASGGYILKGALFNIGGSMFMADSDTAISGTTSDYIKLTVSGDTATAAYTDDISDASWNGAYQGCFDSSGNLYITDEQYGIRPPYTVLTDSGTYTVPPNVFVLHVKMYGPGADGTATHGGKSGEFVETELNVTPGDTYSYAVTTSSTVFGSVTAAKGGGLPYTSVSGGGQGAGLDGYQDDGEDATGTYGAGGGSGYSGGEDDYDGGSGALGRVELS